MADATIELLKNYDPKRMKWPAAAQEKLDGVPVRITLTKGGAYGVTRQGETVHSIGHLTDRIHHGIRYEWDLTIVGELFIPGLPFKDISGIVRRLLTDTRLTLNVFDVHSPAWGNTGWLLRIKWLEHTLRDKPIKGVSVIPYTIVINDEEAKAAYEGIMRSNPDAEGMVLHSTTTIFEPGKRKWEVQRMKHNETIDLEVVGFEEATDELGHGIAMVGRVNVRYGGKIIGVGPGKLTHAERRDLWHMQENGMYTPQIAEIKYMKDPTYEALRQPTFQHWRDDKQEADAA